ncbi:MAG: CBS domain-containing protein [Candidatus Bathyarchaeota archaeon]|nr:CBS domain-containing protein [Candidatus Termiticorpusculum sp.]
MFRIKDIMYKNIITVKENISILDAVKLLEERHVGSIIIVDDENKCIGIFTERDAIRVVAQEMNLREPLNKVMSTHVATIGFEASFDDAKEIMLSHKIRHLPVTDKEDKLIGLFSFRAFVDEAFGMKTTVQPPT